MAEEATAAVEVEPAPKQAGSKRIKGLIILVTAIVIGGWLGLNMFISSKTHIETDNAFIDAHVVPVSAKVSGTVARVLVRDNQLVKRGDLLLEIDRRDYQLQIAKAAAGVGMAENEQSGEQMKVEGARAAVQSAQARFAQAQVDQGRAEKLYSRDVLPKEQLDRATPSRLVA